MQSILLDFVNRYNRSVLKKIKKVGKKQTNMKKVEKKESNMKKVEKKESNMKKEE